MFKSNTLKKQMEILGITEYPFTKEILVTFYRAKAFQFHPDVNDKSTEEEMKNINIAYDFLKDYTTEEYLDEDAVPKERDFDIFKIWEPCKSCDSKGYNTIELKRIESCPDCKTYNSHFAWMDFMMFGDVRGTGYHYEDCPQCKSKGASPTCYRCNGRGVIKKVCAACNGKGIKVNKETTIKRKCLDCNGKGKIEIKPFNPVIRKGSVLI